VDEEHLAYDVIKEVVFKGSFLETAHTFEHFKEEVRYSSLPNRINRGKWEENGSKSIEEKAGYFVDDILGKKTDIYLSGKQIEKLESIEKKWMKRLNS
jgi:trimethylamine---corrinoid protein Co-methyltransferase